MRKGSHQGGERSQQPEAGPISLREFGRRIGVSDTAVRKAIKSQRLRQSLGKTAAGRVCIANSALAQSEWTSTSRTSAGVPSTDQSLGSQTLDEPSEAESLQDVLHSRLPLSASTLIEAQRLATLERARKLQFENDVLNGRLIPAERAQKEAFEAERIIRESILNLPARLAGELAAEQDASKVYSRLDAALRETLNATADLLAATSA